MPAPMTGEITLLALSILVCLGKEVYVKSLTSNVIWSMALKSSNHAPHSASPGELKQTQPRLPESEEEEP